MAEKSDKSVVRGDRPEKGRDKLTRGDEEKPPAAEERKKDSQEEKREERRGASPPEKNEQLNMEILAKDDREIAQADGQSTETPEKAGMGPTAPAGASETLAKAPATIRRSMPVALSIAIGLLLAGVVALFFHELMWFVLLMYLSYVLATIVEAPVVYLKSKGVPRTLATVIILLAALALLGGLGYLLVSSINLQMAAGAEDMKKLPQRVEGWVEVMRHRFPGIGENLGQFDFAAVLKGMMPSMSSAWQGVLSGFEVATGVVVCFFIVMYMVIEGPDHLKASRRLLPVGARLEVTRLFETMATAHRRWFVATATNVVSASTLTTLGLYIIGVPGALVLGVIAGLGELIPNIGPPLFSIPAILVTAVIKPDMLVWVVLMLVVVFTIQGYTISPLTMKMGVKLPVLVTLVSVLVMGAAFGVLGVLVAIPLTADLVVAWNFVNARLEKDPADYDSTNDKPDGVRSPPTEAKEQGGRRWKFGRAVRTEPK